MAKKTLNQILLGVTAGFHAIFGTTDADDSNLDYTPETVEQAESLQGAVATATGLPAPRDLFIQLVDIEQPLPQSDPLLTGLPPRLEGQVDGPRTVTINAVSQALFDQQA